jgi:Rod binding domain-containing protein
MTHAANTFHSLSASGRSPLNATKSLVGAIPGAAQHKQLVKQTQKWVAQTFYGTLLKQVRKSPFRSKIMDGGRGGEAFGSMYDEQMAERMSRGVGSKLVNSIVRKIEAKQAYQKAAAKSAAKDGKLLSPAKDTNRSSHVAANLRA